MSIISGEEIRQMAAQREETCSKSMKDSYYYGFREGAKWAIKIMEERLGLYDTGGSIEN